MGDVAMAVYVPVRVRGIKYHGKWERERRSFHNSCQPCFSSKSSGMWQSHDKPSDVCSLDAKKPANGKAILSRDSMAVMVPTWLPASLDAIDDHDFI